MLNLSEIVTELLTQRKQMQQELGRLDRAIAALRGLDGRNASPRLASTGPRMSAAARRKISQAKKAWWAKKSAPTKRSLSLVARQKIAAAQRARWARVKREKKAA